MKMSSSAMALVLAASAVAANAQTVTIRVHHATPGSSIYQNLFNPGATRSRRSHPTG